jgi:hypothetical protein
MKMNRKLFMLSMCMPLLDRLSNLVFCLGVGKKIVTYCNFNIMIHGVSNISPRSNIVYDHLYH